MHDTAYYNANGMGLYYAFFGAQVLFLLPACVILLGNGESYVEVLPRVLFFLIVCAGLKEPLENMMNVAIDSTKINVGMKRIDELLEEPEIALLGEGKPLTAFDIEFDNVDFTYPGSDVRALSGVSFRLPKGSCSALVGPSGGGKSSIAQLLLHFYEPEDGAIRIGGVDIREVTHSELVKNIAYVFQDSFLFNDTIENNIRMGNEKASFDEVRAAARAANIDEMIETLPAGYKTVVTDSSGLSGGEKQRIAIARAILKDAPIVFLDEATASLDPGNEILIQNAIDELVKNKTVLVIAHRLQSVMNADDIIVLDDGKIIEEGTHRGLLEKNGRYASLWKEQQTAGNWQLKSLPL